MNGEKWLVNDCLSALGESTHWHELLSLGLVDKTGGYTPYEHLAERVEHTAGFENPSLVVRNGTYFRHMNLKCRQIAFVQDVTRNASLRLMQNEVINRSDVVVFNSEYTRQQCQPKNESHVIPIGVDFDLFKPCVSSVELPKDTVLFVGAASKVKGWEFLKRLIEETPYHYALVMKDNARFDHPRVTNFGRVHQTTLVQIMNACACLVCTSETETQHLAGIEAAACGLPLVVPNVGIYHRPLPNDCGQREFGYVVGMPLIRDYMHGLSLVMNGSYLPRQHFLDLGCDRETCRQRWKELIG